MMFKVVLFLAVVAAAFTSAQRLQQLENKVIDVSPEEVAAAAQVERDMYGKSAQ